MSTTLVIAEAGSTWRYGPPHLQLAKAKQAVRVAKRCGADAVKFQWTSDPRAMEKRRKVKRGSYDILAWPVEWLRELAVECEEAGIEFMCTVFLPDDVLWIDPLVARFKIASLESLDEVMLRVMTRHDKPVLVSLGAMTAEDVHDLSTRHGYYTDHGYFLQCTAAYPAPLDAMHLRAIQHHELDGFSDHSGHPLAGALAVACGAQIVEVHFRLDRTPKDNPDFPHSHSPAGLRRYIGHIREAERMLGDGKKIIHPCEKAVRKHRVK